MAVAREDRRGRHPLQIDDGRRTAEDRKLDVVCALNSLHRLDNDMIPPVSMYKQIILLLILLVIAPSGFAVQHRVDPGESIQSAIDEASNGDTLLIHPGDYRESLVVDVSLSIIGRDYPSILGGYEGHTVQITAPNTVLDGLRVSESGTRLIKDMACILIETDSVTISNCRIDRPLHGIYSKGGSYCDIHHNRIEGRLDLIESDRGNGIHLWNSKHNKVYANEILNVRDGIYFSFADSTRIFDNRIHHVRYGLHYMYSNENRFSDNLFTENVAGAALMYSEGIHFERNVFAHCRGLRAYGILFQSMSRSTAVDNLIFDNSRGLFFSNSDNNTIVTNDIVDNDHAVQLNGNCSDNVFSRNNFIGNLSDLLGERNQSNTNWSEEGRGNYWSSYGGYNLDGDKSGDIPHLIQNVFQLFEADVPEIRFYLFSPAAKLLEVAEKTLPILELSSDSDPHPSFRILKNDEVPWSAVESSESQSNALYALFYGGLSVLPIWMVWRRK